MIWEDRWFKEWRKFIISLIPHKVRNPVDSYKPLLVAVLRNYKPKRIIEWGRRDGVNRTTKRMGNIQ